MTCRARCLRLATTIFLLTGGFGAAAQTKEPGVDIPAKYFRALQAAMPAFIDKGLNVVDYKVRIGERGGSIYVVFISADAPPGSHRGSPGSRLTLEVELNTENYTIIRSYFAR